MERFVQTTIKLNITGITLLSEEEYEKAKKIIPLIDYDWWLRTAGSCNISAAFVDDCGCVDKEGLPVDCNCVSVRPALIIDLDKSNLSIGDKFIIKDKTWTIISNNMALCDSAIGEQWFMEDFRTNNANNYETSDVKKYIENWWRTPDNIQKN